MLAWVCAMCTLCVPAACRSLGARLEMIVSCHVCSAQALLARAVSALKLLIHLSRSCTDSYVSGAGTILGIYWPLSAFTGFVNSRTTNTSNHEFSACQAAGQRQFETQKLLL